MADRRRGMHNDEVQSGYGENQDRAGVPGRPSSQCYRYGLLSHLPLTTTLG